MKNVLIELFESLGLSYIWKNLAWSDILQRYKRTRIGPFWGVISTGIVILFIGPVYSKLFGQKLEEYFPYVAISYILWGFISTLILELANSFIAGSEYIRHMTWPFPVYFYRCILRNLIVLSHNFIIAIPILLFYSLITLKGAGLFFIGLGMLLIMAVGFAMIVGTFCLRYRDIPQLIGNFLSMLFFVTPVFWSVSMLGEHTWIATLNPMFHILEILRQPLLGKSVGWISYAVVLVLAFLQFMIGLLVFKRCRNKLAFWA